MLKHAGVCAQVLVVQLAAKKSGYADVVYLDAKTDTYLEEVSSCNIFTVKGNVIKTPPLKVCPLFCKCPPSPPQSPALLCSPRTYLLPTRICHLCRQWQCSGSKLSRKWFHSLQICCRILSFFAFKRSFSLREMQFTSV